MLNNKASRLARFVAFAALVPTFAPGASDSGYSRYKDDGLSPITRPLPADYRANKDGSMTVRVCYNWSCASREHVTFTAADLAAVKAYLTQCAGSSLYDRVQTLRVGIWQLQLVAQKYLPKLANDREINEFDREVEGRLDCVDSASNTTTYLRILQDLGQLPGWTVTGPEVRNLLDLHGVHWTAVVIDGKSGTRWSVDSWFRPHGHLPFVMPLADWVKDKKAWEPPFSRQNPYPDTIQELCPTPSTVAAAEPPREATAIATLRR
jgi:hypothetical protein